MRNRTSKPNIRAVKAAVLILAPAAAVLISLLFGRYSIPLREIPALLVNPGDTSPAASVIWQLRLPRALAAAFAGASLAVSGAAFQSVFRNPLVNSGILGVSNGAGFGACLAIVCFGGGMFTYLFSFSFAVLAVVLSAFAERMITELRNPQIDWRQILNGFIQEEICDYSFSPPDRRFEESTFFLPDFSEKDESVRDVLFMIDTSGSMSDDMVTAAYSEIKGAIDQFNGKLQGWLGFFDAAVIEPKPFQDEDEFSVIRPCGGGGTDFQIIFEYVGAYMTDRKPVSIIILTDGFAPFPNEKLAGGIPVLWLLNNECVNPPWGKVARIKV